MNPQEEPAGARTPERPSWTFLSNHAHVLVCLDRDPDATMREIADQIGITLRAVQTIVADLTREGYLNVRRHGRRNHYTLDRTRPLRHRLERHTSVGDLLRALAASPAPPPEQGDHAPSVFPENRPARGPQNR